MGIILSRRLGNLFFSEACCSNRAMKFRVTTGQMIHKVVFDLVWPKPVFIVLHL